MIKRSQKNLLFAVLFIIYLVPLNSQDSRVYGKVIEGADREPVPFATIILKNKLVGTTSNELGEFLFRLPEGAESDTLVFSSMGFESEEIPANQIELPLTVILMPFVRNLDEVVIVPYPPEYYIKQMIMHVDQNYPSNPFETRSYYREQLLENHLTINHSEGIFKSYYPNYVSKKPNQHQVLLYREAEHTQDLQFMKKRIEKHREKARKKGKLKEDEDKSTEEIISTSFGGPDSILSIDFIRRPHLFLDSTHFGKYDYWMEPSTVYEGNDLTVIGFKARRTIQNMRSTGKIFIDNNTYALVALEYNGRIVIPAYIKPLLFVFGLGIKDPRYDVKMRYHRINDHWYPQAIYWNIEVKMLEKKMFKKNLESLIDVHQLLHINETITAEPKSIPIEKQFDAEKDMNEQIYPESDVKWETVNIVKSIE